MSLGFIGGLGAAMEGYTKASENWEKREQASAAEQRRADEHTHNQQKRQIEMDEIERTKTIRAETEVAAKPLEVHATQEQLGEDVAGPPATLYKAGNQTFTDETKAKQAAADPYAAVQRAAQVRMKYGDVDGSLNMVQKMLRSREQDWKFKDSEAERQVNKINNELTNRLFGNGQDFFANGAGLMTELDKDGNTYKAERQANGTVAINKYGPGGTTLLGTHKTYADSAAGQLEALYGFMQTPTVKDKIEHYKTLIKTQQEQREAQRKIAKDETGTLLDQERIRDLAAKRNGEGYYAKQPKEPKAPKPDAISEGFKHFSPDNKAGRAEGENLARQAKPLNPGATDQELIHAAQAAVVEGPDSPNIKPRLDMNTGQVMAVFTDPRTGKQIKLHQSRITPDAATPEQKLSLKTEVQAYLAGQDKLGSSLGSQAKWSDALKRAAANPKDSDAIDEVVMQKAAAAIKTAKANVLQRRQTEIAQGKPPTPIPSNPMEFHEQVMQSLIKNYRSPGAQALINKQLSLIRTYGLN